MATRIAIAGFGKIARDQHAPAIAASESFELVAVVEPGGDPEIGVPWFSDHCDLLDAMAGKVDALAICTPPPMRPAIARDALAAGLDILLEKPPAPTLKEARAIVEHASKSDRIAYAAWHSRHAPAVEPAARHLAGETPVRIEIRWCESVRKWHSGQDWVWEEGGFGVLDPGINALSILTAMLDCPLSIGTATLSVPGNRVMPIAATARFVGVDGEAVFDWRQEEGEIWQIAVETHSGKTVEIADGGAALRIDGTHLPLGPVAEYRGVYERFAHAISERDAHTDLAPLELAIGILTMGRQNVIEPFEW